jgi:hypothetical protein
MGRQGFGAWSLRAAACRPHPSGGLRNRFPIDLVGAFDHRQNEANETASQRAAVKGRYAGGLGAVGALRRSLLDH